MNREPLSMNHRPSAAGRKDGIAIVLVLGLLAVLMIAAVAFCISMRVERRGAANYRYTVQAKHMLWSGLSAAIEDINNEMDQGTNLYLYPDWDVMTSTGSMPARVLSRTAMSYIPGAFQNAAATSTACWRHVVGAQQKRGGYAYMALNLSGLLDANRAGGTTNSRMNGADPSEIVITNLPDLADLDDFNYDRSCHVRYETLPEFTNLNRGLEPGVMPSSFAMYSMSPLSEYLASTGQTVSISKMVYIGDDTSKWDSAKIKAAFKASGGSDAQLDVAYNNLLDYVDSNSVPQKLAGPCGEAIPMLNEAIASYNLKYEGDGTINARLVVEMEHFFPFNPKPATPPQFGIVWDLSVVRGPQNSEDAAVPVITTNLSSSFGGQEYEMTMTPVLNSSGSTAETNINVHFFVNVAGYITNSTGDRVDEVPSPYDPANGIKLEFKILNVASNTTLTTNEWCECVDPRFNWTVGAGQWMYGKVLRTVGNKTMKSSRLAINDTTRSTFDPALFGLTVPDYDRDGDTALFVRNKPLTTVGELGHLCLENWMTIRLYDHGKDMPPTAFQNPLNRRYHKVLDYFTLSSNFCARGLVNLNSSNPDVLASVFCDAPENEWETDPAKQKRVNYVTALNVANAISNITPRPLMRVSSLGGINWKNYCTSTNEIAREGPIRNSSGLFTVRHNLFTILLSTESYSEEMGGDLEAKNRVGQTLASTHAVAEVWRDPFPMYDETTGLAVKDKNGNRVHRCFVRYFKVLDD